MEKKGTNKIDIDNICIYFDKGFVKIKVNPKIFPLEIVYSASYIFIDQAYVFIDGDPKKEIVVKLRPKEKEKNLEQLGIDFNNELLNYAVYENQSNKNKVIKEAVVQKALFTDGSICTDSLSDAGDESLKVSDSLEVDDEEDNNSEDCSYLDDPLGIAKPWEETHKKSRKDN